jgi:small subunit ribosomal protein S8
MALSDPISDFLTVIRNGSKAELEWVEIEASRMKANLARIMKEEGFIRNFKLIRSGNRNFIRVELAYENRKPVIKGLKRTSRPSLRRYAKHNEMPNVLSGLGVAVVSTSKGVMTGRQATEQKVGGEVLCEIW